MKGGDILGNLYNRRIRDLINRLYKKMGKDYRPKILGRLIKDIDKPRSTLRECFDRWRRIIDKENGYQNITKYKAKIININVQNLKNRNNRDKLMRAFFHWRAMSKRPEEYYPKINNLLQVLTKNIKNAATEEPFDKIRNTRNPNRYLLKVIKNYKNQEKRALDGKKIYKIESICQVGYSGPGMIKYNQDNFFVYNNLNEENNILFIGVCDGHG